MGHKKRYGTHETLFSTYLVDFVWRREFYGEDVMYHLWSQIAEIYPVENWIACGMLVLEPVAPKVILIIFVAVCLHNCCCCTCFSFIFTFSYKFYNNCKSWHNLSKVPHTCLRSKNKYQIRNQHYQKPQSTDLPIFKICRFFYRKICWWCKLQ